MCDMDGRSGGQGLLALILWEPGFMDQQNINLAFKGVLSNIFRKIIKHLVDVTLTAHLICSLKERLQQLWERDVIKG